MSGSSPELSVAEAAEQLDQSGDRAMLVLTTTREPLGIATRQDLQGALLENKPGLALGEVASHPADALVVAVERESETVIPRGDTQLRAGDCIQVLVRDKAIVDLHEHLASFGSSAHSP